MSADNTVGAASVSTSADLRRIWILRYAFGTSLAMGLALGVAWPLSYLTPVLTQSLLGPPARRPSLKVVLLSLVTIAVACLIGVWLSRLLLPYKLVFVLMIGLALFHVFYAQTRGARPFLVTWLLIALSAIPIVSAQSMHLSVLVSRGIVFGAAAAVVVVWLAHGLFPDPPDAYQTSAPAPPRRVVEASTRERIRHAYLSTAVVYPLLIYFNLFERVDAILVLVFVALLSQQPGFAKDFKAGAALIIGNVMGGISAIVFYEVLVVVPLLWYMVLLTFLGGLFFGSRLFSSAKTAKLFGMAFSTTLLVVGSTTTSTGEAGAKVWTRVVQITIAVVYVVVAFGLWRRLRGNAEEDA